MCGTNAFVYMCLIGAYEMLTNNDNIITRLINNTIPDITSLELYAYWIYWIEFQIEN